MEIGEEVYLENSRFISVGLEKAPGMTRRLHWVCFISCISILCPSMSMSLYQNQINTIHALIILILLLIYVWADGMCFKSPSLAYHMIISVISGMT